MPIDAIARTMNYGGTAGDIAHRERPSIPSGGLENHAHVIVGMVQRPRPQSCLTVQQDTIGRHPTLTDRVCANSIDIEFGKKTRR
ncbi:hypothetical protein Acid7E03_05080 [Acidisoma sp. 7E03]